MIAGGLGGLGRPIIRWMVGTFQLLFDLQFSSGDFATFLVETVDFA